jgi:hypothetical protein
MSEGTQIEREPLDTHVAAAAGTVGTASVVGDETVGAQI